MARSHRALRAPAGALTIVLAAGASSAAFEDFDGLPEGFPDPYPTTIGAITFTSEPQAQAGIDQADGTLSGRDGFSPDNIATMGALANGPLGGGGAQLEWVEITAGELVEEFSADLFFFDFFGVGNTITVEARDGGVPVATDTFVIPIDPASSLSHEPVAIAFAGGFDSVRFTASGAADGGRMIVSFDNVRFGAPAPVCSGDVDGDGDTDVFDFADLAESFGAGPGATREQGDLTGDGFVDVFDFGELAEDFGCGS